MSKWKDFQVVNLATAPERNLLSTCPLITRWLLMLTFKKEKDRHIWDLNWTTDTNFWREACFCLLCVWKTFRCVCDWTPVEIDFFLSNFDQQTSPRHLFQHITEIILSCLKLIFQALLVTTTAEGAKGVHPELNQRTEELWKIDGGNFFSCIQNVNDKSCFMK